MVSAVIVTSWQEAFVALHSAERLEDLWTVLLVPHGFRSSSGWDEPYGLFRHFHADEPSDAAVTALLLCSDHRWRKAAHRLIHELADSGLLDDLALDQLAGWFLAHHLDVSAPRRLFAGQPAIFTSSSSGDPAGAIALRSPRGGSPRAGDMVGVRRFVWPPLRRWAAGRQVRRGTATWRHLLDFAPDLPSRDAAMVLAGVMDATASINEAEQSTVTEIGLASSSGIVRLAALRALADLEGIEAAMKRAAADPSEKVRAWATKQQPEFGGPGRQGSTDPDARLRSNGEGDQPSLF